MSWVSSRNNANDMNGIRVTNLFNGIRAAGFPRIDVDKTGGPRNGWIYVTTLEKFIAPATDSADVILHRSTDGGSTWTSIRVNQDTPGNGKFQYHSAVRVDEGGGVNIIYYDTRNTPTNDSAEVFVSRSTDGGNTWTDILVSDHKFRPKPITGTATGYQGDYIGISSGRGLLWPFWCDDITGSYQAWTASVRIYAYPLSSFNLNSPAAGTTIQTFPNNTSTVTFNWDTSASTASFRWVFGSPNISTRKITFYTYTNSLSVTSGQLDNLLAEIGVSQGDSITGQWDVWAFRNNAANDSLISSNGSRAVTFRRLSPALTAFNLFSPLNNTTVQTLSGNSNPQYFKWRKSGAGVNYKLFYASPDFSSVSNIKYSGISDNSGFDTLLTFRNSYLDSLVAGMGVSYGDSVAGQWKVYAYNGSDSLASNLTYNLKFRRGTAPFITTSADSIVIDLPPNQTAQRSFVIGNTGQNPLNWFITESLTDENFSGNKIMNSVNGNSIHNPKVQSDIFSIDWAEENPSSGTIPPLDNQIVNVIFNSAGLVPNTIYTGNLNIQSNDPLVPVKIFKLRLNVGPLGVNSTENGIPDNFELMQNFPNPFNPATQIKYALPVEGFVTLKIYDLTGKEVVTLVDEAKSAGYYVTEFNASALASGLYFYSITVNSNSALTDSYGNSGNFSETRKMLLIK